MKKAIAVVLSLMFIFTITSISGAAEKKEAPAVEKKEAAPVKKEVAKRVTGNVAAVDSNAKTITVKGKKGDVVISVDDKTKIMAGKDAKTLADIKAGDKVAVMYIEADGKNIAKSININIAPAKKK